MVRQLLDESLIGCGQRSVGRVELLEPSNVELLFLEIFKVSLMRVLYSSSLVSKLCSRMTGAYFLCLKASLSWTLSWTKSSKRRSAAFSLLWYFWSICLSCVCLVNHSYSALILLLKAGSSLGFGHAETRYAPDVLITALSVK